MGGPASPRVIRWISEPKSTSRSSILLQYWKQRLPMPTISAFYGILIRMFFNDHPPAHFPARYGEFEATIEIATLKVLEGELPQRALNLVRE